MSWKSTLLLFFLPKVQKAAYIYRGCIVDEADDDDDSQCDVFPGDGDDDPDDSISDNYDDDDDDIREQVAGTVQVSSLFEAAVHWSLTKEL